MKYSLGISNFLKEISSLSHSIVFLYFFALISEEGFLISLLWNSAFKCVYLSFSPLLFASFLFTAIYKASSDSYFAFLHLFFLGMVLIPVPCTMSWTSVHSSSGTLSISEIQSKSTRGKDWDFRCCPVLPRQGAWVWSLVGELRSKCQQKIIIIIH